MRTFVAFVCLCLAVASAQFSSGMYSPWATGYGYGDRSCPVSLLWELSSIVSTLYGYGQDYSTLSGAALYGGSSYGQSFSPLSVAQGFQRTSPIPGTVYNANNPYNPTCPWPLINGMIAQIQTYVNQLQSAQTGSVSANNPFPFGYSPFSRGVPGVPGLPGAPSGGGAFRGVKK